MSSWRIPSRHNKKFRLLEISIEEDKVIGENPYPSSLITKVLVG
jgi:hypothetical protein